MKITDTRDQTVLEGELVAILPAGEPVPEKALREYYKLKPDARNYELMARPCTRDRFVLQRGDPVEKHFYIVPHYDFYKVEYEA